MTRADADKVGHFGDFMESYGSSGLTLMKSYEMQGKADAKPRLESHPSVNSSGFVVLWTVCFLMTFASRVEVPPLVVWN